MTFFVEDQSSRIRVLLSRKNIVDKREKEECLTREGEKRSLFFSFLAHARAHLKGTGNE